MSHDIRQSEEYASFLRSLGWIVEKVGDNNVFIRRFLFLGSLIKLQRTDPPLPLEELDNLAKKYRAYKILIESNIRLGGKSTVDKVKADLSRFNYKITSPFLLTKTVVIDLIPPEQIIFKRLTPEKQRAVRRSKKNNIVVKQENSPEIFIRLKKLSLLEKFIIPVGVSIETKALARAFGKQSVSLIAYLNHKPVAGIFILKYNKTAYYWLAAATKEGKKLFAPTLLVWEALRLAKGKGCKSFDFEGIYDERFPHQDWLGFTKFKEGFGGKIVDYLEPYGKKPRFHLG